MSDQLTPAKKAFAVFEKVLKSIQVLLIVFLFAFAVYFGVFISTNRMILTEVRAYNQCSNVEDYQFTACYELHR